jgi:hypothetical protein
MSAMANDPPIWQRVTCHPAFAVLLLAASLGGAWAVVSESARMLSCFLARCV